MTVLSPSLLACDLSRVGDEIQAVTAAGASHVHIDVMDGMFVPSITYGMPFIKSIRKITDAIFDVHLMIEDPGRYIDDFVDAGADIITVHQEACVHLDRTVEAIKARGKKAGVAINPGTSVAVLDSIVDIIDMVLIMSVNPGFGGQRYIPYCTDKIAITRKMLDKRGLGHVDIQVDGGITLDNVRTVLDAGANVIVAGSSVFRGNSAGNVRSFLDIFREFDNNKKAPKSSPSTPKKKPEAPEQKILKPLI
ncbi:MAG: ribulose-phosphate 3-epimerase [Lachnospiraceae bacterium]|nr:ribulose-phosphate 3-epimerase [Lachnospiraceae bacterium]